jgi:pimeloyl-ACP methyl ester carboxylesterase
MTHTSPFKSPEGEAAFLEAYDNAMKFWPVTYEESEITNRFGTTHVVTSGPKDAPPLVLLHGMLGTLTMWSPNIADLSKDYRVYAIDVMGQPGKSVPNEPIRDAAGFVAWLSETFNGLDLDRLYLVGMSYGAWLAIHFTLTAPERVQKLVLLSPVACFQPLVRQFILRMLPMGLFPTRLTVNSFFGWMGINDTPGDRVAQSQLDLTYLGMKHFRFPPEAARLMPGVFSDEELRTLPVPVLLLIGEREVLYDPVKALARARRLISNFEGELVPQSSHDMCVSQHRIVDERVLAFLNDK